MPEICQSSRQLFREVMPMFLASKPLNVNGLALTDRRELSQELLGIERSVFKLLPEPECLSLVGFNFHSGHHSQIELRLEASNKSLSLDIRDDNIKRLHPQLLRRFEQLRKLARVLVHDRTTSGLGMADVLAVADFIHKYAEKERDRG